MTRQPHRASGKVVPGDMIAVSGISFGDLVSAVLAARSLARTASRCSGAFRPFVMSLG